MARFDARLSLEHFDYTRVGDTCAVMRILARPAVEIGSPSGAELVVDRGSRPRLAFAARACHSERWVISYGESALVWRALFAVPFALVERPDSFFQLTDTSGLALALPEPRPREEFVGALALTPALEEDLARLGAGQIRQRAVALATAVAVTASSTPAAALAASGGSSGPAGSPASPTSITHAETTQRHIEHLAALAKESARRDAAHKRPATAKRPKTVAPPRKLAPHAKHKGKVARLGRPSVTRVFSQPQRSTTVKKTQADCTAPSSTTTKTPLPTAGSGAQPVAVMDTHGRRICVLPGPDRKHKPAGHQHGAGNSNGTSNGGAGLSASGGTPTGTGTGVGAGTGTGVGTGTGAGTGTGTGGSAGGGAPTPVSTPIPTPGTGYKGPKPIGPAHPQGESFSHQPAPTRGTGRTGSGGASLGGLSRRPPVKLPHASNTGSGGAAPTLEPSPPGFLGPKSWTGTSTADPGIVRALGNLSGELQSVAHPPRFLIPIYMEAGKKYDVPWQILASINSVETNYGRDLSTSSAGAIGWMQFMPATWREWGVAADGHSVANPYDPRDAIFSAARYLSAAGASQDISRAIYAYNHATWYVDMVLARARAIADNVGLERQTLKGRVISVFFATDIRKHPTVRFRGGLLSHYTRLISAANMVSAANFPYLYGGGHEQPARFGPFDCSGSVSYVMQQAGYKVQTTVSGDIPSWKFPAGPGRVTIFYNPTHTFMRIGNRYFGTSGFARPGGGAGWFDVGKLPEGYLAQFREVHVPHLGIDSFAPPKHHHRHQH